MRGPDELRELCPPLVWREVLGVGVPRPDALEDDLVLGLVARAARLDLLRKYMTATIISFCKELEEDNGVHVDGTLALGFKTI